MVLAQYLEEKYYGPRRRRFIDEARAEGRAEGKKKGRAEAFQEFLEEAYQEGIKEGREQARAEAAEEFQKWNERRIRAQAQNPRRQRDAQPVRADRLDA